MNRAVGNTAASVPQGVITPGAAESRAVSVEQLRRALKGDLSAILLRALCADPARRYGTVRELSEDVRRPVAARGGRWLYRARKFAARNRWRIALGGAAAAAVLAAGVYSVLEYGRDQRRMVYGTNRCREPILIPDVVVSPVFGGHLACLFGLSFRHRQPAAIWLDCAMGPPAEAWSASRARAARQPRLGAANRKR